MPTPKSIFGQIWAQKLKVIRFVWKLAHMVSQGCWFLFQYLFSEFQILIFFLGKFGPKKSKLSVLTENWYTWCFEIWKPKIHFWANLGQKSQSCPVWLKIGTQRVSTMVILIPTLFFSVLNLKSFLDKFEEKKLFILTENWHTWYFVDADSYFNNSFLNCQLKIHFWANLGRKSQSCLFCLKTGTHAHAHTVSRRCWFLFRY